MSGSPYSMIPAATSIAGQNNNVGGIGALNSPWGGSGMDLNSAGRLLDPVGISGNGGLNKSAIEAFLDPAGIDSGSSGLNLFGQRGANSTPSPTGFPNLGASTLNPVMPGGSFQPIQNGNGRFNNMAAQGAGGLMFNPATQTPAQPAQSTGGSKPTASSVNTGGTTYSPIALPGGGGNPALGSPGGSALSRSQIYVGNFGGPHGVTEPADPAFLNNLGNGMMAALKAQYGFYNNPYLNPTGGYNPNGGPK